MRRLCRRHVVGGAALAALLAFALAALTANFAYAHAVLVASEPADGAILGVPPARLTLTFNEPVAPLVLRLIGPDGTEQAVAVRQAGAALEVSPSGEIRDGTHLLSWRVVSADGHPIGGTVIFSIGHASEGGPPSEDAASDALKAATWAARIAMYVAMFVGVGGAFFVVWVAAGPPYPAGRFLYALLLVGLVAAPVSLGLQGVDLLSVPLTFLAVPAAWEAGLRSSYAITAALAFVSFFAAQIAFSVSSRRVARVAASIAFAGTGFALAASGHASAAEPQFLMRSAVFMHALSVAFWIGALLPLAASRPDRSQGPRTALRRLSRVVPFVLAALLASGAVLAWVQVGVVPALWRTDYGRLLLAKLGLFALLLVVALYNRFAPRGRAAMDEPAASRAFVRTMRIEIALALAIFAVTAGWRFTPPPRALAVLATVPATLHVHSQDVLADVRFDPGRAGPTTASIVVMTGEYGPLDAREVQLALSKQDSGIEPVRRPATRDADGVWRVRGLLVPQPGRWTVRIDVLVSDFEKVTLEDVVEFRP
jgi:copper transport protein